MFSFVLKKFFTERLYRENKDATSQSARCLREQNEVTMSELKETIVRSRATLGQDFLGAASLVAAFVVLLTLPGLV